VIIKDFPLTKTHPWALRAAVDSNCIAENGPTYWQFSDYVHTHQQEFNSRLKTEFDKTLSALDELAVKTGERNGVDALKLQACIARQNAATVQSSLDEGRSLGVSATPTVFCQRGGI